jgi:hypothetical protein
MVHPRVHPTARSGLLDPHSLLRTKGARAGIRLSRIVLVKTRMGPILDVFDKAVADPIAGNLDPLITWHGDDPEVGHNHKSNFRCDPIESMVQYRRVISTTARGAKRCIRSRMHPTARSALLRRGAHCYRNNSVLFITGVESR